MKFPRLMHSTRQGLGRLVSAAVVAWFLATSGIWLVIVWLKSESRRTQTS